MKPYYEHAGIAIYHGDCREILPQLPKADVILTDPPWPMGKREIMMGNSSFDELWGSVCPLLRSKRLLVWAPIHADPRRFLNPLSDREYLRLVYIRRAIPGYYGRVLTDGEIIYALGEWPASRKGRMVIPGGISITYLRQDRADGHPGPRSLIATRWVLSWWSDEGDLVLDPFMGAGTTLVAAKDLHREAIGIEIEERYCEVAAKRLGQEVFELKDMAIGGPCF